MEIATTDTNPLPGPALAALNDPRRLAALRRSGLMDSPPEEAFDRLTRLAAGMVGAPTCLVSLVGEDRQFFKSAIGLAEPAASERGTPLSHSFCRHALAGEPFVVSDARLHPLVRDNPAVGDDDVISYLGMPLTLRTGETLGTLCVIDTEPRAWTTTEMAVLRDLAAGAVTETELRVALAAERERARRDPLTGLLNHGALHASLADEQARARRAGAPVALILLDVDHFKAVNDAHGHLTGDAVLVEVAARLAGQMRAGDVLGRVGGEEFAWILPGADADAAASAAERARRLVGAAPVGAVGTITISAGVAARLSDDDPGALYRRADAALYTAKERGRDRIVVGPGGGAGDAPAPTGRPQRAAPQGPPAERRLALAGVRMIARVVDAKDPVTRMHSERVASMAVRLATELGWTDDRASLLHEAGLVHDVGKIGVPDAVLFREGPLSDSDVAQIRTHASIGAHIVEEVLSPEQSGWVRAHHERLDGRGYPDGIAGAAIPEGARILAVADSWDAMTMARHYSVPMSPEQALEECRRESARQFCPRVVTALERLLAADRAPAEGRPASGARTLHRSSPGR